MTETNHNKGDNGSDGDGDDTGRAFSPAPSSNTDIDNLSQKHSTKLRLQEVLGPNAWKLTPATFRHKLSGGSYLTPAHIKFIAAKVAHAVNKGNARLIITICGRHGKSQLLSVSTPPWFLDKYPDKHVISVSYGADLAQGFSRDARDFSIEHKEQLNFRVRGDVRAVNEWQTTAGGGVYATGMGGPIIGRGGDLYLIDDFLKSAKESMSPTIQQDQWSWFQAQCITRMEPGGSIIILAHRWNTNDLVGKIHKELPGVFEEIRLPVVIETEEQEADDPLGRKIGDVLWEYRYNREAIEAIKRALSKYWWAALYQQDPIPVMGGIVTSEMIPIVDILPHRSHLQQVRAWDLAATPGAGDWLAGGRLAKDVTTGLQYILNMQRFQESPAGVERKLETIAGLDGYDVEQLVEQEPGASGKIAAEHLVRSVLRDFRARAVRADQNKFMRAQPFYAAAEHGFLRMYRGTWNKAFCDEFDAFPDVAHDDQIDVMSAAYNYLNEVRHTAGTFGREQPGKLVDRSKSSVLVTGVTFGRG